MPEQLEQLEQLSEPMVMTGLDNFEILTILGRYSRRTKRGHVASPICSGADERHEAH